MIKETVHTFAIAIAPLAVNVLSFKFKIYQTKQEKELKTSTFFNNNYFLMIKFAALCYNPPKLYSE